jgi:hypothetical protein
MTAAEFAAAPKTTPTAWAEEGYQAKLRQRRPMPIGPAGLAVPPATALFRKVEDRLLLANIARAAYKAMAARILPQLLHDEAAAALSRDLVARFPQDDMLVLERYGAARGHKGATVSIGSGADGYSDPVKIAFAEPVLAPVTNVTFYADLGGKPRDDIAAVPEGLLPFFRKAAAIGRDRKRFDELVHFPAPFRTREGRWPRWQEIERQVPEVGEWLAQQRRGAR